MKKNILSDLAVNHLVIPEEHKISIRKIQPHQKGSGRKKSAGGFPKLFVTTFKKKIVFLNRATPEMPQMQQSRIDFFLILDDLLMMTTKQKTGKWGESLAKTHLESNGYQVLECNWRFGKAEIDLIAGRENLMVFIEVKTRKNPDFGHPESFVSDTQARLIKSASEEYQIQNNFTGFIRFDIISITGNPAGFELLHLEDAF